MRRWLASGGAIFTAFSIFVLSAAPALAWGQQAHRAVALIADRLLQQSDPAVRSKIRALLATDKDNRFTKNDIASEATWADMLMEKSEEARFATAPWHSARLKATNPDLASACFGRKPLPEGYPASHGPRENCVVDKVMQFEAELQNADTAPGERLAALQFLLNLIGDLHDPLDAIDRGDRGGQCVALQIGSKPPVRLVTYWQDTLVNEVVGRDPTQGAGRILGTVSKPELEKWAAGKPEDWLRESYEVAKTVTYGFGDEKPSGKHTFPPLKGETDPCGEVDIYRVGPDYETKALAAVKQQLAKAGDRLAFILRGSFK
jgi:S1/P1 Nuclease